MVTLSMGFQKLFFFKIFQTIQAVMTFSFFMISINVAGQFRFGFETMVTAGTLIWSRFAILFNPCPHHGFNVFVASFHRTLALTVSWCAIDHFAVWGAFTYDLRYF